MRNPSRSIIHPPSPDGIIHVHLLLLLLLLLSAAPPYATAQSTTEFSEYQYESDDSINPSLATIIIVSVFAFFVMGIFTIFLRKCADNTSFGTSRPFAAAEGRSLQLPHGLDPSVIESFPIFVYSEVKDIKIGKGALECAVCLSEFEGDENLRLLPKCDHVFHPECIDAWLASHTTCPVCRSDLTLISGELAGDTDQKDESNQYSTDEQNPRSELSELQDQVSINVEDETQKQRRRVAEKFPRSHSTGHSLVLHGENCERYTLRLPEEFRKEMMIQTQRLKRTKSCVVVLPREGSSRRGYRSGGEGSSRGKWVAMPWRSDRVGRSDRWVFTRTPPFFTRSTGSPKVCSDGVDKSSAKTPVSSTRPPV